MRVCNTQIPLAVCHTAHYYTRDARFICTVSLICEGGLMANRNMLENPSRYFYLQFITVFTTARHLSLSWAKWSPSTLGRPVSPRSILILSRKCLPRGLRCCATNRKVAGSIPGGVSGFFIDIKSFRSHYGPGVDSASNRNEYQEYFLGGKGGRCVILTTLPPSCAVVTKSGNLDFLEPSGTLQACNGTALPLNVCHTCVVHFITLNLFIRMIFREQCRSPNSELRGVSL